MYRVEVMKPGQLMYCENNLIDDPVDPKNVRHPRRDVPADVVFIFPPLPSLGDHLPSEETVGKGWPYEAQPEKRFYFCNRHAGSTEKSIQRVLPDAELAALVALDEGGKM